MDRLFGFDDNQSPRTDMLNVLDTAESSAGPYQGWCIDILSAVQDALDEYKRADKTGIKFVNGDGY